jgi:hypothetical protein
LPEALGHGDLSKVRLTVSNASTFRNESRCGAGADFGNRDISLQTVQNGCAYLPKNDWLKSVHQ